MPLFQSMGARGLIFNPTLHAVVERVPLKDVLLLTSSYLPNGWFLQNRDAAHLVFKVALMHLLHLRPPIQNYL